MANFYAKYPASSVTPTGTSVVQGLGTAGTPVGGLLTVQGDPAGTPIPISGSVVANNASVSTTGTAVPASATYGGMNVGGTLTGLQGTAGGLKVDGSASTQPVSGTVTANQGSPPWTVTGTGTLGTPAAGVVTIQGGTAMTPVLATGTGTAGSAAAGVVTVQGITSMTPLLVNGSGSTQPVSGTVTANQGGAPWSVTGTGTAGTAAAGVVSIQGIASMTAVKVDGSASTQPVSGTVTANQGGAPWTVTGTGTAGTAASGVVTIQGIASMTAVKVDASATTQPANITQFGGTNVSTGTGTGGAGIPRVTVSSDSSLTSVGTVTTVTGVTTVSTVTTVGAVTAITNALPAGSNIIGNVRIDQTTPGTTNGVVVNTIAPVTTTTAVWQAEGSTAFGSITTSFVTIFTPSAATKIMYFRNNTNGVIAVSMDAGTTTNLVLDPGDQVATDYLSNSLKAATTAVQIKYTGSAPTSGSVRVNGVS